MTGIAYRIEQEGAGLVTRAGPIAEPGPGQVLLRNLATAVNFHDILNIMGVLPNLACPRVPFSDNCGEILAIGEGVSGWTVGDRVLAAFFPNWESGPPKPERCAVCYGDQIDGFLQTHTVAEAKSLVRAPRDLTPTEAATLPCAGVTAWRSLVEEAAIEPGQTVLVQGTGGVSLFALQIARMRGAKIILTSSSEEKLALGRSLGADQCINYRETPDWDLEVLSMTGGRGADVIVEIGGADTFERSLNAVAMNGHISVIGVRSGFGMKSQFSAETVLIKNVAIRGITVGSVQTLRNLSAAFSGGGVRPVIGETFPLAAAEQAMDLMKGQTHCGKIGIEIAQSDDIEDRGNRDGSPMGEIK